MGAQVFLAELEKRPQKGQSLKEEFSFTYFYIKFDFVSFFHHHGGKQSVKVAQIFVHKLGFLLNLTQCRNLWVCPIEHLH